MPTQHGHAIFGLSLHLFKLTATGWTERMTPFRWVLLWDLEELYLVSDLSDGEVLRRVRCRGELSISFLS